MRLHRFYIEQPLGEELVVEQKEIVHQCLSVFRYEIGDEVIFFSKQNRGIDYIYKIKSANKKQIVFNLQSTEKNIFPKRNINLYMALVKKDTFENIVRYATEIGVSKIEPILASRSEKKSLNLERINTIAKEASEQSGRGFLPEICEISDFTEAFEKNKSNLNIFTSLNGEEIKKLVSEKVLEENISLWIGPEGGWTKEEESIAIKNNSKMLKLTNTVLKADTAAIGVLFTLMTI